MYIALIFFPFPLDMVYGKGIVSVDVFEFELSVKILDLMYTEPKIWFLRQCLSASKQIV